ncbi:Uu.00g003970.m01.CDS01 [Anthostomella pinea]|uniref:Uu.00g003970.m01.CDS01 n=1 Tax=Anthostomella pinea TaxID=933095 RepID=A0AAI8VKK6_9PEZI|nr:Uu.00g003970.m01.CDS01 [Anthostomella pinea]
MLPVSLVSLYETYKEDTKAVTKWIANTARDNGYSSKNSGGSGRLKGKARTKASSAPYAIRISDFEPMTRFIVQQTKAEVPGYIPWTLDRAIRWRTSFGINLSHITLTDTEADKKHVYFIDVLKKVSDILEPHIQHKRPAVGRSGLPDPPSETLNRFGNLTLYEPSVAEVEEVLNVRRLGEPPTSTGKDVLFEPWQEDRAEALFRWYLFNQDVQRIRREIGSLWENHRAHEVGLAGVATAHNLAINIVRGLEEEVAPLLECQDGFLGLSLQVFLQRYVDAAADEVDKLSRIQRAQSYELGELSLLTEQLNLFDQTMYFASMCIIDEAAAWDRPRACGSYKGQWGQFSPNDDWHLKSNLEKYNEDRAAACEVIQDLHILTTFLQNNNPQFDEFASAINDIVKSANLRHTTNQPRTVQPTFRSAFATQLLLYSIHILGKDLERPFLELMVINTRIRKSAMNLDKFRESKGAEAFGHLSNDDHYISEAASFWDDEDPVTALRRENGKYDQAIGLKDYVALKHNPLLLPLCCARLYFPFVQEKLLPAESWPDMEAFMILHRKDMWIGRPPKAGEYKKAFRLTGGHSITSMASDRHSRRGRDRPALRNDKKAKMLTPASPMSRRLRLALSDQRLAATQERDIPGMISESKIRWRAGRPVRLCPQHDCEADQGKPGRTTNSEGPGNHSLLQQLAIAVDAEEAEQSFDYMSFRRVSWMVLNDVLCKGRPILDRAAGNGRLDWGPCNGTGLRNVVAYVFELLFLPNGRVLPEAAGIAEIIHGRVKALGRTVYTSTGRDWAWELRCTCDANTAEGDASPVAICLGYVDKSLLEGLPKVWVPEYWPMVENVGGKKIWFDSEKIEKYVKDVSNNLNADDTLLLGLISGQESVQEFMISRKMANRDDIKFRVVCKSKYNNIPEDEIDYGSWTPSWLFKNYDGKGNGLGIEEYLDEFQYD